MGEELNWYDYDPVPMRADTYQGLRERYTDTTLGDCMDEYNALKISACHIINSMELDDMDDLRIIYGLVKALKYKGEKLI